MPPTSTQRFPALTGIRFPLAAWVICYHISAPGQMWSWLSAAPATAAWMPKAYVALGTFFALSGFVLANAYLDGSWNGPKLTRYLIARVSRIAPLYYASLAVVAPIIWWELQDARLGAVSERAGLLFGYLFLLQGWARYPVDWNTPAWSLSCEIFYYACLPFAGLVLRRGLARSAWLLLLVAFGLPAIVRAIGPPADWKAFTYIGDFVVGLACAALYRRRGNRWEGRGYWLYTPAGMLAGVLLLWGRSLPWLAFDELMRLANGAAVLGLALGGGLGERILSRRIALAGGAASFAAYILHVPILWWFRRFPGVGSLPDLAQGAMYVAAVWIVAMAAYRWIEVPAGGWMRTRLESWSGLRWGPRRAAPGYGRNANALPESTW